MTRTISDEEFYKQTRELFRNLRNWSGEALMAASDNSENRGYLRTLIDTGKMAKLRRGRIGGGTPVASVAWVIEPHIPDTWKGDSHEYLALYQAALLYTMHPHTGYMPEEPRYGKPITSTFLQANGGTRGSDDETRANDRRINFLLDSQPDEIYDRLSRVMIPLMNKSEERVDWIQLARDLRDWNEPVRLRWSRGWYGGREFMRTEDEQQTQTQESESVA